MAAVLVKRTFLHSEIKHTKGRYSVNTGRLGENSRVLHLLIKEMPESQDAIRRVSSKFFSCVIKEIDSLTNTLILHI